MWGQPGFLHSESDERSVSRWHHHRGQFNLHRETEQALAFQCCINWTDFECKPKKTRMLLMINSAKVSKVHAGMTWFLGLVRALMSERLWPHATAMLRRRRFIKHFCFTARLNQQCWCVSLCCWKVFWRTSVLGFSWQPMEWDVFDASWKMERSPALFLVFVWNVHQHINFVCINSISAWSVFW